MLKYNFENFKALTYFDVINEFLISKQSPRSYLENCLEQISAMDSKIKAFVSLQPEVARRLADDSSIRWANGHQLSAIDGMPIGIKDLLETCDMPTQMGCDAYKDTLRVMITLWYRH